jgi:hypothetical protein
MKYYVELTVRMNINAPRQDSESHGRVIIAASSEFWARKGALEIAWKEGLLVSRIGKVLVIGKDKG